MPFSKLSKQSGIRVGKLDSVPLRFKCSICKLILSEPVQGSCGHRYCRVCIESAGNIDCSICIDEEEDDVPKLTPDSMHPDNAMIRELNRQEFFCPWEPECSTRLRLPELMKHAESECMHRRIKCSLSCGQELPISSMENHQASDCPMRRIECSKCHELVPQSMMENHLDSECSGSTKQCQSCTARVKDSDEARREHAENQCPVGWVDGKECPFGCGVVTDAMAHRKECVNLHIDRMFAGGSATGQEVSEVSGQPGFEEPAEEHAQAPQMDKMVLDVENGITLVEVTDSVVRYGLPHAPNQTGDRRGQQDFFERIAAAFSADRELEKELRTVKQKMEIAYRSVDPLVERSQQQYEELVRASDSYSEFLRAMAMKEVRISSLQSDLELMETSSTDGTLVWKITYFKEKTTDTEYEACVHSPILYSEKFGYKLQAVAYLNGRDSGRGSHISLYARILQGPFDATKGWPFKRTVTFVLLDQSSGTHLTRQFQPDQSSQFQRPSQPFGQLFGFDKFVSKDELEVKGFLKDDTLFVKVQIAKPPLDGQDF